MGYGEVTIDSISFHLNLCRVIISVLWDSEASCSSDEKKIIKQRNIPLKLTGLACGCEFYGMLHTSQPHQWKGKWQNNNLFFVNRRRDTFQPSLMDPVIASTMFRGSAFCDSSVQFTLMKYKCSLEPGELHSNMRWKHLQTVVYWSTRCDLQRQW